MILDAFLLDGRNALVTGSRRGLGAAMARALAQAGANVMCHGREPGEPETCAQIRELGRRSGYFTADLTDRSACDRLVEHTIRELGSVDILINNAGLIRRAPASEHSMNDWDEVIAVNLNAVFRLSQLAAQHMLGNGGGKIINIASVLSFQGGILVPGYAAAKGAVAQLTKALANEWASRNINVNAIAPGYMATDNTAALREDPVRSRQILDRIPAARWGAPCELAGAVVFLSSSASEYVHGHVLVVDGGWLAR
jgi:2-deoxy-D-gluconate 3-dehydrogenase